MVEAVFEFIAENPPTALIVGGILMLILSVILSPLDPSITSFLIRTGWGLIILGVVIHLIWLLPRFL